MSQSGYSGALEAAGCTVHECRYFGDYQGEWIADVTLPDGRRGFIRGSYGSCSGCDAFEAEIESDYHQWKEHDGVDFKEGCAKCEASKVKLAEFGRGYFSDFASIDELAEHLLGDQWWIGDDREVVEWIVERPELSVDVATRLRERLTRPDYE
jgi:hypothetical protein